MGEGQKDVESLAVVERCGKEKHIRESAKTQLKDSLQSWASPGTQPGRRLWSGKKQKKYKGENDPVFDGKKIRF